MRAVVAIDVGGTAIKAALCDQEYRVLDSLQRRTPVADGVPAVVDAIVAVTHELRRRTADRLSIEGIGLILPGVVDAEAGIARYATNLGWRDLPIRAQVGQRTGLPVGIEHDVRAAGLAEARLGASRGFLDALFVAVGTGIAAVTTVHGNLVAGAGGLAGEIGHVPAFPDGERCACGQRGCTETYASAAALSRRYGRLTGKQASAEQVIALQRQGDPAAEAVFRAAITALARTLVHCTMLLDPAIIVLGGGLSGAGAALLDPLQEQVRGALAWREPAPLVPARFGVNAGRVGAAIVGWQAVTLASTE
jgi:glucokinase